MTQDITDPLKDVTILDTELDRATIDVNGKPRIYWDVANENAIIIAGGGRIMLCKCEIEGKDVVEENLMLAQNMLPDVVAAWDKRTLATRERRDALWKKNGGDSK